MASAGIPARRSAAWLLERVMGEGRLLGDLIGDGALERLQPADRARAQRLAEEVLRNLPRADALIARHVGKTPPLPIRTLLRLGATELGLGAAAHGVVNDLVEIAARNRRHGRLKGLVNAVLRKMSQDGPEAWAQLPVPQLPSWLREPLVEAWGATAVAQMEAAHLAGAPLDLTARSDPAAVAAMTGGTLLPTGTVRIVDPGQVTALPGFETGEWWVQDAAAAIPAQLVKGARVLDLCAAPGGKTLQLAARGAKVTAVDISAERMARVEANLARTGLRADLQVADAFDIGGQWDAVLLDAPCSATGTIRRHPDLPHARDGAEIAELIALQTRMIDHALDLLRPGGQLVFATCSLLPDEGEVQLEAALSRHAGLTVDQSALATRWIEPGWRSAEGGLRLRPDFWPDRGGMDGFYVAAVRKRG